MNKEKSEETKNASRVKKIANKERQAKSKVIKEEKPYPKNIFKYGYNDDLLYTRLWDKVKSPKAVMLILHGMVEHCLRYDAFAKKCNEAGIIVFAFDLRGHGYTVGDPSLVGKYQGDIFGDSVKDAMKFADDLLKEYKLPLIVFGHSFGSFLLQEFVQNYKKHSLAIFSGSANMKGDISVTFGNLVAKCIRLFYGKDAPAKSIYKLSFGAYGKPFDKGNWLSSDYKEFDKYNLDPYCGSVCSAQFYCSFFGHLAKLYKKQNLNKINKDMPMLITSGAKDPVGGKEHKSVDKLDKLYRDIGVKSVTYKLWDNGRHEILNELNKDEIQSYIIDYILQNINK